MGEWPVRRRRPPRSAAQMEELVARMLEVPAHALDAALAAARDGLATWERTGSEVAGYTAYYTGLQAYLERADASSRGLALLGAARVGAAFGVGAEAVEDTMYELGWVHE